MGRGAAPQASGSGSAELKEGIAKFYDESSSIWEEIWGEHMHHGYYADRDAGRPLTVQEHREAQVLMIDKVLEWAGAEPASSVLDVGCGIGGSTRHIVRKFSANSGTGITLSPYQASRARQITDAELGSEDAKVEFLVADALAQPFEDDSFDLVWSLESGEHMPDKTRFLSELFRVCKPGGRVIIVTWCHRVLKEEEAQLGSLERGLLALINKAYYLPEWCSVEDYRRIAEQLGMEGIRTGDWSPRVAPFWTAVLRTALTKRGIAGLWRSGLKTARGAAVMPLMRLGFATGTIKFNLITATKPE